MRFLTDLPGLNRDPPGFSREWASQPTAADFQTIAQTADQLDYEAINAPEHIVMPNNLAPTMGAF